MKIDEDTDKSADEMLDWFCWSYATLGERFYPPEETAAECVEALSENHLGSGETDEMTVWKYHGAYNYEEGQHYRVLLEANEFYRDMETFGFDPKGRAKREVHRARENGLDNVAMPSFDWLNE